MSRGLSQQQRVLLAAVQEAVDLQGETAKWRAASKWRAGGRIARAVTIYRLVELAFADDLYRDCPLPPNRRTLRPYALRSGAMTRSMFRSWQRALSGLVRRELVVRLPNTWRADHCLTHTTPEELAEAEAYRQRKQEAIKC
jgi:hypothetical protein